MTDDTPTDALPPLSPPAERPDPAAAARARPASTPPRRNPLSRLIYRLLALCHRWAESGWGGPAVASWGFLQSSVVPGPTDTVLVPLGIADPGRVFRLAAWATLGAVLGGLVAYLIGAYGFEQVGRPLLRLAGIDQETVDASQEMFLRRGWAVVLLSTVSPLSTKMVCIAAGAFDVPFWQFLPALVVGRGLRFLTLATLLRFAGPRLLDTIARRAGVRPASTVVRGAQATADTEVRGPAR